MVKKLNGVAKIRSVVRLSQMSQLGAGRPDTVELLLEITLTAAEFLPLSDMSRVTEVFFVV